jgi:glycosyltransferase involved in cell wall biosynthesis
VKIVLINTSERTGGAGIACNRLMKALNNAGHQASMLVRDKDTDDPNVVSVTTSPILKTLDRFRFMWERWIIFLANRFSKKNLFAVSVANTGIDISNHPLIKDADIIHLHWINQGYLSLKGIKKLIDTGKPIVWTMHDMWPCTGICHHAYECENYKEKCGNCFFLRVPEKYDLSYKTWRKKQHITTNIQFITVSNWLKNKAKESSLTGKSNVRVIPNVIDTNIFYPGNKQNARQELEWSNNKKIILMGAATLNASIKGFTYLRKAFSYLPSDNYLLVLFGNIKNDPDFLTDLPVSHIHMGTLTDSSKIATLYRATDVTVVPSLYETFGQTISEAMACGCPVVSFNNSGQCDIIDHKVNGYLAEYKSAEDLAQGIRFILNEADTEQFGLSARDKVIQNYSQDKISESYLQIYNELIQES